MSTLQIYDYEKDTWRTVSKEEWDTYNGYKRVVSMGFCHEYNKPETSCRRFYTVEMVRGSGRMAKEFDTYEEAYAALCNEYVREINEGYTPTLYKILRHDVTRCGDKVNTMIQPTWSE